jgi:hypothetical protein
MSCTPVQANFAYRQLPTFYFQQPPIEHAQPLDKVTFVLRTHLLTRCGARRSRQAWIEHVEQGKASLCTTSPPDNMSAKQEARAAKAPDATTGSPPSASWQAPAPDQPKGTASSATPPEQVELELSTATHIADFGAGESESSVAGSVAHAVPSSNDANRRFETEPQDHVCVSAQDVASAMMPDARSHVRRGLMPTCVVAVSKHSRMRQLLPLAKSLNVSAAVAFVAVLLVATHLG